jgi:malonyl-CoA O-methyltransferase
MTHRPASADFHARVATRFDAAAASYDAHSPVQRHAAARLAGLIATAGLPPRPRVLEIGCGTGHLTHALTLHLPGARILATDIAPSMVAACQTRLPQHDYAAMDGTRPVVTDAFDLICANLVAQWFADLPAALARLAALLAPGGVLALSLLGDGSFREWRAAHTRLGLSAGALDFPTRAVCASAFPAGNLTLTGEHHVDRPDSALGFLRGLRAIGADTAAPGHRPLTSAQLRQVMRALGDAPEIVYELLYAVWRSR